MKKLCVFDFDGTLFNTIPQIIYNIDKTLKIHGFPQLTYEEYDKAIQGRVDEFISKILEPNNTKENIEKVSKTFMEISYAYTDDKSTPYDGIYEMLQYIQSKNIRIAINSNRNTDSIKKLIKKFFNDINFFDIKGFDFKVPAKPDPSNLLCIVDNMNVNKNEIIYIGDTMTDLLTAQNANIECVLVEWGQGSSNDLKDERILKVISKPSDLYEIIE